MIIVIVGGNECMVCKYKDLCKQYSCRAKVFAKMTGTLHNKIGNPDLVVFFTNTVSHKMVKCVMSELKGQGTKIAHVHSSSLAALKNALEEHVA